LVTGCCFVRNNNDGKGYLFYLKQGIKITVSNCTIDDYSSSKTYGAVTLESPIYSGAKYSNCPDLETENNQNIKILKTQIKIKIGSLKLFSHYVFGKKK
jgi:hypothetical protein